MPIAFPSASAGTQAAKAIAPQEVLAMTLWAEAGTRPVRAIEALAATVMNRVRLADSGAVAHWVRACPVFAVRHSSSPAGTATTCGTC
ncbi:hypothetical protein [Teichococcus vastitatis]|uniref:hypothetical protein n=1 Tax=Teichococcus vastitatis TaxID=2307076 RepID=UPI001EE3BD4F|nr:hypothetical protein [Pseudoroseomonas vastitatis]